MTAIPEELAPNGPAFYPPGEEIAATKNWDVALQAESEVSLYRQLDSLSSRLPEIRAKQAHIATGAHEIIDTFQVRPEFFADADRALIFTSLASIAGQAFAAREQPGVDRNETGRQIRFVANAAFVLTRNYSQAYPELVERFRYEQGHGKGLEGEQLLAAHRKYEQPEVTRELTDYIMRHGVIQETQERMGIDPATAEVPPIHVLGIGRHAMAYFDFKKAGLSSSEMREWERGLLNRTEQFANETTDGKHASRVLGFNLVIGGKESHLFMPMDKAEILLAREQGLPLTEFAVQQGIEERLRTTIRHEYAHTVDDVLVEVEFGKSLEERRAEYYAGDTGGYHEVKGFFSQLGLITGNSVLHMLDQVVEARHVGENLSIYELMAKGYGLDKLAEIATVQPDSYVQFTENSFTKETAGTIGGHEAFIRRLAREVGRRKIVSNFHEKLRDVDEWTEADTNFVQERLGTLLKALGMSVLDMLPERFTRQ